MRPGPHSIVATEEIATRLASALDARSDVLVAYLFGSHGRGAAHERSDVDVAVWLREPYDRSSFGPLVDLNGVVTTALKRDDVDVVILNEAPLRLAFDAIHGRILVDKDEESRVVREAAIKSRYHDRAPYHSRHIAHEGRQLAERGFS